MKTLLKIAALAALTLGSAFAEKIEITETTTEQKAALRTALALGNVDNTSDANKPISTAAQVALNNRIEWVNVKNYGAAGDGTADDTAEIQAACDTGKNVYFPAGTYKISAEITLSHHKDVLNGMQYGGQTFAGDSIARTKIKQVTAAANGFRSTTADSYLLVWRDMTVESTAGWTSTGSAFSSSSGLNLWWQLQRVGVMRWKYGYKLPSVQATIQDCYFNDCETSVWFEDSVGIGVNRNSVLRCGIAPSGHSGQVTGQVAQTAVRFDSGKGHLVDGLDVGGAKMNRIIHVTGGYGTIRGVSAELFSSAGNVTSLFDSTGAGFSAWSISDCMALAFTTMLATDWPVIQGKYCVLTLSNMLMAGTWQNGLVRQQYTGIDNVVLEVFGQRQKIDSYNETTSAIVGSYYTNPFPGLGAAALPTASTSTGSFLHEYKAGSDDDRFWLATQRAGSALHGWDNLNQYNSDVRMGRMNNLAYQEIPAAGITASADNFFTGFPASLTLDGNDATKWGHNGPVSGGTSYLKYDFGTARKVAKMRFKQDGVAALTVVVTGSNDDSVYTEVGRFKTTVVGDLTQLLNSATAYRYLKLSFATTASDWLGVWSVQFWRPVVSGEIVGSETATYANDAAADADTNLPSGAFYLITGGRTVYRKP